MIGLQKIVTDKNIRVDDLAKDIGITSGAIWKWFQVNRVPKRHLKKLSEIFNVSEEYINEKVNDIITYTPKYKGFNEYKTIGETTIVYVYFKKETKMECLIDTEDLQKLIDFDRHWCAIWFENVKDYYICCMDYDEKYNNKSKSRRVFMHRFVMNAPIGYKVDHIHHDGLDNRKVNLRVIENKQNVTNRKGANSNNKTTGVRNVNYFKRDNEYWVQIMKDGKRYKWKFPAHQFEEACEFAEEKRREIFGDFAGLG